MPSLLRKHIDVRSILPIFMAALSIRTVTTLL
jgi:hypothetical protein